jgi:hypothetical protein
MRPARLGEDSFWLLCDLPDLDRDCVPFEVRDCAFRLERDCAPVLLPADFALRFADGLRDERDEASLSVERLPRLAPALRERLEAPERERPEVERELEDARTVRD